MKDTGELRGAWQGLDQVGEPGLRHSRWNSPTPWCSCSDVKRGSQNLEGILPPPRNVEPQSMSPPAVVSSLQSIQLTGTG